MMAIVTIAMPSLMDRFISNLRFLQVVIKPRRVPNKPSWTWRSSILPKMNLFPEGEALLVASSRYSRKMVITTSRNAFPETAGI
jgi:hypothetical protein